VLVGVHVGGKVAAAAGDEGAETGVELLLHAPKLNKTISNKLAASKIRFIRNASLRGRKQNG
jgi:hypothetical protein